MSGSGTRLTDEQRLDWLRLTRVRYTIACEELRLA